MTRWCVVWERTVQAQQIVEGTYHDTERTIREKARAEYDAKELDWTQTDYPCLVEAIEEAEGDER